MSYSHIFTPTDNPKSEAEGPEGYDVPSAGLIATGESGASIVVYARPGSSLYYDSVSEYATSLEGIGITGAPPGISVWEGEAKWFDGSNYGHSEGGSTVYNGKFRRLTSDELVKIQRGEPLWPPLDKYLGPADDDS